MTESSNTSTSIPKRDLTGVKVPFEVLRLIPEDAARHYGFVPIGVVGDLLEIGITDPDNIEARDAASFFAEQLGMPYKFYLISETDFENMLGEYQGLSSEVGRVLGEIDAEEEKKLEEKEGPKIEIEDKKTIAEKELEKEAKEIADGKEVHITEEAPVTKIVAVIIQHATEGNASDVHIEPIGDKVRVRFRVDGILYTSLFLPFKVHDAIVARIKILTNMKLDEKRKPQDGRFSAKIKGQRIDFRVSTLPTYHGEKVEIRILNPEMGIRKLDKVGLTPRNYELLHKALKQHYGLVLLTGPTGSGKTTTLYAMLNELDREKANIISLEDPVEYNMEGINQSQVRPEIDYTFATGLRAILRQDPNIVMVGEIRDRETAELAIQAALTGHLVFSTLHTNNAIGVVPRLVDMGIDPYLIAPTLILAVAQRLSRTICPESKDPLPVEGAVKAFIDKKFSDLPDEFRKEIQIPNEIYRAKASPTCSSGTRGRMAIFEMLPIDRELQNIILKTPNEIEIYKYARAKGFMTMQEDALIKAFQGLIPFEEVNQL